MGEAPEADTGAAFSSDYGFGTHCDLSTMGLGQEDFHAQPLPLPYEPGDFPFTALFVKHVHHAAGYHKVSLINQRSIS